MKEIERKFLVKRTDALNLESFKSKKITQEYLYSDIFSAIRKRKIEDDKGCKYIYTVKTKMASGYGVEELEKEIDKQEYDKLISESNIKKIEKIRYIIPYRNKNIELDIFEGEYKGISFAEIEFESEEEAKKIVLPEWFDKELTGKVSNSMMAKSNYKKIKEIINKI